MYIFKTQNLSPAFTAEHVSQSSIWDVKYFLPLKKLKCRNKGLGGLKRNEIAQGL